MASAPSLSTLHSLARLYDIQTSYYDVKGQRQEASPQGLVALLRALGAPIETTRDIPSALRERREHIWQRLLEPIALAWDGKLDALELRQPAKLADRSIRCSLRLETGETQSWTLKPANLRIVRQEQIEGTAYVVQRFHTSRVLPKRLPHGYHHLTLDVGEQLSESLLISAPVKAYQPAPVAARKLWGVFLPLYALHSSRSWGAGDLGDLETLTDWTAEMGGQVVATLPLLATFLDDPSTPSPYAPASRLFWNEFYIDVSRIPELTRCRAAQILLDSSGVKADLDALRAAPLVEYRRQMAIKRKVLEQLARCLLQEPSERHDAFRRFVQDHPAVVDYACFRAAGEKLKVPWQQWPQRLRDGDVKEDDYDEQNKIYHLYAQWIVDQQIEALSEHASETSEGFYLDLPLGVHGNGYDVWRERASFVTQAHGGAPPDAVFTKGQNWEFAPLRPEGMRAQGYRYVRAYLRHHMARARVLRIDHVMGLHRLYMIPNGVPSCEGAYVRYPAEELYATLSLESHRNQTWLVGENLGTVPQYVEAAMARHRVHSMYVVQYELAPESGPVLPMVPRGSVASLNTHDMPPFSAYWKGLDIDDRLEMGLLDQTSAGIERQTRQTIRKALEQFLRGKGHLRTSVPDQHQLLQGCLNFLGASEAALVLINLEDLWFETEPQNVPESKESRPNWTRKARYSLEAFCRMPLIIEQLQKMNQIRKKGRKHAQQNHGHESRS